VTGVELCMSMMCHAVWGDHTAQRRPSEVKEALKFFFTDEEIAEALAIITGRQDAKQLGAAVTVSDHPVGQ